jgi:ring-1,2-phenylacetyl-CoA epoxidase subunit PaaB
MNDSQWPRFMVFQQEGQGEPMVHNGTVHAPDIELAMQNARDVFVRRPEATALWVVPAEAIYTQTREQLADSSPSVIARSTSPAQPDLADEAISHTSVEPYYVFGKFNEQAQCRLIGEVQAASKEAAIQTALSTFEAENPIWWWVFPAAAARKSDPADADAMFAPARAKSFKDQAEYPVVTMMRQIRDKGKLD